MTPNPLIGVVFHWLGGLASGSFYVPFRAVRKWSWETYWLVGGVFSWIIVPWVLGSTIATDLFGVLHETEWNTIWWVYFFGVLWGFGGLTFGLTMRYLGMSLGMAMVLGYCAAFGTLVPPIYHGTFFSNVLPTHSGQVIVLGIAICMAGIAFAGKAGMSKEKEMSVEQKTAVIREFNLKKGVLVATFSGVMSACFSFGLDAGAPIKALALKHGTSTLWQGLPVLTVLLAGGFTTNFVWCLILNIKNHTGYQYFSAEIRNHHPARGEEHDHRERDRRSRRGDGGGAARAERRAGPRADVEQLLLQRAGRHHLVLPVLLLHHGRDANGQVQVLQLDAAYGEHHHLQQPVGHRAARMARRQRPDEDLAGGEPAGRWYRRPWWWVTGIT